MKTEDVWEFIFKEQLEYIDKETLPELRSNILYSEESLLFFFIDEIIEDEHNDNYQESLKISLTHFTYPSGFKDFINSYAFVRMASAFPVCKRI